MKTLLNNFSKSIALLAMLFSIGAYGQMVGTNCYLIGDYLEIGVNGLGHEGAASLAGSNNRSNQAITSPVYFGFVANPLMDGWVNYDGDFFTPGSPENGFGFEIAGVNYHNNCNFNASTTPGSITGYNVDGDCITAFWEGSVAGLDVEVVYKLITTEIYYTTTVYITNTTGATMTDIYYYRNFDPDNNVTIGGGYSTQNTIVDQWDAACPRSLVTATQTAPWPSYVGMGGIDPDFRVTYGGFINRDASNIWNGVGFTDTEGSTAFADQAISLAHRTYTLAPGETDTFTFTIVQSAAELDAAFSGLYSFSYVGATGVGDVCNPITDTVLTCSGDPVTISVAGPGAGSYAWTWSPPAGLSTTTGPTTDAGPTVTTTYTVTGVPTAGCLSTPIVKDIVVDISPAPDVVVTDPGPQCMTFDLNTLVVTDLNAIPGALTSWYSVPPDSSTQVVGLLPDMTMEPGDFVYVMMYDPISGCFDFEPVIITFDSLVNAGADYAESNCSGAGILDLAAMLSGADPGGTWAEITAGGTLDGVAATFDITSLTPGDYIIEYTVDGGACPDDVAVITLTVETEVNAGLDNATSICNSAGSSVDLNPLLSGADAGGTWAETSASGAFTPGTGILDTDGLTAGVYTFTYTVPAIAPCLTDVADFTVTVEQEANAGADNTTSICNGAGSSVDCNTLLSGADPGGTWAETTASGAFTPGTGILDTDGLAAGVYTFTYTVAGVAPCIPDVADFTITVEQEVDAGLDNISTDCNTAGASVDLNTLLSGADPGGAWAETSASGAFTPGTGILNTAGLTPGVYTFTYTMTAIAPCLNDVADFTITVEDEVNAGLDNTTSICNTAGSTVDINTLLSGADAGGVFAETSASGAFTPGTGILDSDGLAAGVYTFTYTMTGVAPCPNDVADFTVTVEQEAIAGPDNSATICNTAGSTLDMNTLLSGAAAGTWAETTASGQFTPGTGIFDGSGLAAGAYTFTYTVAAVAPCVPDVADFTVTVTNLPNAGLDNTTQICNTAGSTVDMSTLLSGADAGGTWAETTASGSFDPGTAIFTTAGVPAGAYTFTYTLAASGPCPGDVADFTVTVEQEVNAGADDVTAICNVAGSTVDINTLLSGADAGGVFAETSGSGAFTPGTGVLNTDGLGAGVYTFTYTVTGVAPCPSDVSDFTVTVEQEVNAGLDNITAECNTAGSTVDINTLLSGADAGGTFAETSASGAFTAGTGVLDTDGLPAGVYTFTYEVFGVAPCPNDISDFTVTVEQEVNAGLDNATSICNTVGSTVDINTLLSGADAGGAFAETSGSGTFTPGTGVLNTDGLGAGVYTFTYTMTGVAPCPTDVADFTVTVEQEAIAGPDNSATLCNSAGSTLDLNTLLTGAAAGAWVETSASGQFTPGTGVFDASGLGTGVYTFTYTVTGIAPCVDDVADITVTVTNLPDAGLDNNTQICNVVGSTVDLNTFLSGADPGGSWTETTGSGSFDPGTGIFTTDGVPAGVYTFTYDLAAVGPCPGDQAVFNVTVEQEVVAGTDDFTPEICNTAGSAVDLTTSLSGASAGGTWTETTGSGSFTPGTGILDTDGLPAGVYAFTYEVFGVAPCPNDIADFTVTVQQEVDAGLDNFMDSCNFAGASIDMATLLSGADAGGAWSETTSSGSFAGGIFDVSDLPGGVYTFTYTVTGTAPCPNDVSTFDITVNEVPVLDPLTDEELCDADNLVSQTFTSTTGGTMFDWTNVTGVDVGFGTGGTGTSIGSFTGSTGSTIDETVTVSVTPYTSECVGFPLTFDITVHPTPQVLFTPDNTIGCEPLQVTFTNSFPGVSGAVCDWTFGDGSNSGTCDVVNHEYTNAGTYDVGLTVTTIYGCTGSALYNDLIEVYPEAVANFEYSPTDLTVSDTRVDFTNSSINADSYTWTFGDGSGSSEMDPTHTYPEIGNVSYTVTLIAHSPGGCDDEISKLITIDDEIVFYVPNVFTPDGDQYNETFKPIITAGVDVYDYHLTIFNRWGEIVFESFNKDYGWPGTYGNGGLVEDGVYIWQMEFGETMSDKKYKHRGHVTILK